MAAAAAAAALVATTRAAAISDPAEARAEAQARRRAVRWPPVADAATATWTTIFRSEDLPFGRYRFRGPPFGGPLVFAAWFKAIPADIFAGPKTASARRLSL